MSPTNLAQLTHTMWEAQVGSHFTLRVDGDTAEDLTLVEAVKLSPGKFGQPGKREPFAVILRAGRRDFYLSQRIYALSHPTLGDMEIFLVPIGPDECGMRFEAIFS